MSKLATLTIFCLLCQASGARARRYVTDTDQEVKPQAAEPSAKPVGNAWAKGAPTVKPNAAESPAKPVANARAKGAPTVKPHAAESPAKPVANAWGPKPAAPTSIWGHKMDPQAAGPPAKPPANAWGAPIATRKWAAVAGAGQPGGSQPKTNGTTSTGGKLPTARTISVMSWNVEHVNVAVKDTPHVQFVQKTLQQLVRQHSPGIIALQEVENCKLVELSGYGCVDSVVDTYQERRLSFVTLGNVILYRNDLFVASRENIIRRTSVRDIVNQVDKAGNNLRYHHSQECTWGGLSNGNGCGNVNDDVPSFSSVLLKLKPGSTWISSAYAALASGIRIVDIHLFAGGSRKDMTVPFNGESRGAHERRNEQARSAKRSFQLRSIFATVSLWNQELGNAPVSFYAGDFNTRQNNELRDLVKASEEDYQFELKCPSSGLRKSTRSCRSAISTRKTSRAGFLDHIAYDSHSHLSTTSFAVLKQPKGETSDHSPILAEVRIE